ncbi:MAG: YlxM family DNA-binding protein [Enterocloster sp.]
MEKIVEQGLLYDFYGELLTEHQRRIYEDVVFNDMSPSEIAREQGISRQGVHDLIRRCDKILEEYEAKLHLVAKFMTIREMVERIESLADEYAGTRDMALIEQIRELSGQITGTL